MKLIGTPHPCELKAPASVKGQSLSPIGKTHVFSGGLAGGFEVAIASALTDRVVNPKNARNDVGIAVVYWHLTAFTRVPPRDGWNGGTTVGSQIPRTISPVEGFAAFRFRGISTTRHG